MSAAPKSVLSAGRILVGGAPEGFDAHLLARFTREAGRGVVHIARDEPRMAALEASLNAFDPRLPVFKFPAWDCLPYDRMSPNPAVVATRMATLATLAAGLPGEFTLLTTLNAVIQKVPVPELVAQSSLEVAVGKPLDQEALSRYFITNGYSRVSTVREAGEYAIRGGIIDVFAPGQALPARLDLFGDILDGVRLFDPDTQRTEEKITRMEFAPISEVTLGEEAVTRFRQGYREHFGAASLDDPLYGAVSEGRRHQGMEHWLPLFHEKLATLFDYLPGAPVTIDHQVEEARGARWEAICDYRSARLEAAEVKSKFASAAYKALPENLLYLNDADWETALAGRHVRQFSPHPIPSGPGVIDAGGRMGRNFVPERQQGENVFDALAVHIREVSASRRVVLASYSEGARERIGSLLADHGVEGATPIERLDSEVRVGLAVWPLEVGFETADMAVIAEQDVLGERLIRQSRRKANNFLTETSALAAGDLVVHIDHGIGRYQGLQTVEALGAPHDCLLLEYAGGDKLYLPVENIELLSRYGSGEAAQLDRLGGGAWQAKKARLKKRVLDMAQTLIRVAAERLLRKADKFVPPEGLYTEFCARFPFEETDDQLSAIADVLEDLSSGHPMDRLICGDVGFGKTEVALRTAFVAAFGGAQVAVIAPTTLLARQHAKNFAERFHGFPVRVRSLSRFASTKEANATKEGLADGTVDIVVGTHALLSKSVQFKNLGLLIVDEEQHFGVAHKERLKRLKSDVHVLTMTATPIPRTLQMSMTGVRELSLIATPPVDRLAIRIYIAPFDGLMIREALLREHYRGGQAFFVVPRIRDLPQIEEFLREEVPEVSFRTAHGQMPAGQLDDVMNAFYDGAFDVLLATTIVESGLDIPAANTLIVHRADMFGLAQLYQIRGRVGRSKTRAYAFFTTEPRKRLTPAAEKRLKVLGSLDSLGAGFTLASHDLDIRGAGNLLGDEQSGHIREVGFELYREMLEEALAKMREGGLEGLSEVDGQWSPQISLSVPVLIPETYIEDLDVRLGLYRRLSALESRAEVEGFAAELHDRFGKPPREVETLLRIVRIKAMCRKAGIARLDCGPKGALVQFRQDKFTNPAGLVAYIDRQQDLAKIRPDHRLVIRRDWQKDDTRIKGAFMIARDLARIATEEI